MKLSLFELCITRPLGFLIRLIYECVQNYGLAIILFTIIIKLILLPLQIKSQKAMKKQQKIQPVIAELQKKYANDQQRLQTEMMKIYKDNNISMTGDSAIIHDSDIRTVVNELFASGAEAISINGERLVSTSSIRCVGPTVLVNNTRLSIPFEITAIGDSKTLEAGLIVKGGIVDTLTPWGIDIKITRHTKVEVPAYRGFSSFKYAEPVVSADQKNVQISGGDVQ